MPNDGDDKDVLICGPKASLESRKSKEPITGDLEHSELGSSSAARRAIGHGETQNVGET